MTTEPRGVDLFRVAGIQITVDVSWLVIFALVLWSLAAGDFPGQFPGYEWPSYVVAGLAATLCFFASVLVHELSHAVVANRLGADVRRITLFIFGGMAHLSAEPRSPGVEWRIAAAGPLTSIGLGVGFLVLSRALAALGVDALAVAVCGYLGAVNLALAVFNLLPGYPLDGGRLLRAWFWQRSGDLRAATRRAAGWGGGIAVGLMGLGALQIFAGALIGGLWLIFIGMFLRGAARASGFGAMVEHFLGRARVRDLMVTEPVVIDAELSVAAAIEDYFLRYGYGGFPVGVGARIAGLLSLSMVQQCPPDERARRPVRDIMRPLDAAATIDADASVSRALEQMTAADLGRLVVVSAGQPAGLITRTGILRFVQAKTELEPG